MDVTLAYQGRSQLQEGPAARTLRFAPNLARDPVAFDAALRQPLRFREAISTLHDVVISDLRYQPRDKSAYEVWKKNEEQRLANLQRQAYQQARLEVLAARAEEVPRDLEKQYRQCLRRYWKARQKYSNYLLAHAPDLWRTLMPCDPVVTVGEEVVFFECFSADESSYGCLTVEREDGFGRSDQVQFGTTNVDYSWDLYHHFQALRSYRPTRFRVDPEGFEVATAGSPQYREEKIELPPGWLRGFMQIQVAMGLPMRRVRLAREAVYSVLAWLKRHKARQSPRAIRFELLPDKPPRLVLEPWEQPIVSHGTKYQGPGGEPIRIWGGRRLLVLARLLPLVERLDVYLLGTGLPSFWVARMGEMRLTLGLSGWTTNDWTRSSALDLLAPPGEAPPRLVSCAADLIRARQAVTFEQVQSHCLAYPAQCAMALNRLAHTGQVIYDLDARRYRWRQVMPRALGEAELGPENPELIQSRWLVARRKMQLDSQQDLGRGLRLVTGWSEGLAVEAILDTDGLIRRGKCGCSHHRRAGIRQGPCRHLLALRQLVQQGKTETTDSPRQWWQRLQQWAES